MRLLYLRCFYFLTGFTLVVSMISCSKEPQPNTAIEIQLNDPVMSATNIEVLFSDSGRVQAKLTSTLMNRYGGQSPYLEFPKGFKVYMYDSARRVASTITGKRGLRREYTRVMEAWGDVIVRNEKTNEQLNTEHLIWDENQHRIWSDVKVKITRPDQVLFGNSMESNEAFTRYSIQAPTGEMDVKKDSI